MKDAARDEIIAAQDTLWNTMPADLTEDEAARWRPDAAALSDLQAREVAMATSDLECADESGYTAALAEAERQGEAAYVDEHRDELEALVARYADR